METRLGLDPGGALFLVRYLLANKIWRVDMMQPIVETMALQAFRSPTDARTRRAQR
jgi:hypothetical protein